LKNTAASSQNDQQGMAAASSHLSPAHRVSALRNAQNAHLDSIHRVAEHFQWQGETRQKFVLIWEGGAHDEAVLRRLVGAASTRLGYADGSADAIHDRVVDVVVVFAVVAVMIAVVAVTTAMNALEEDDDDGPREYVHARIQQ
jgi:hypothetical protein